MPTFNEQGEQIDSYPIGRDIVVDVTGRTISDSPVSQATTEFPFNLEIAPYGQTPQEAFNSNVMDTPNVSIFPDISKLPSDPNNLFNFTPQVTTPKDFQTTYPFNIEIAPYSQTPAEAMEAAPLEGTTEEEQKALSREARQAQLNKFLSSGGFERALIAARYGLSPQSAAFRLGQSISYKGDNKGANLLRGVGAAGKLGLGLGRSLFSGMASQKRSQEVTSDYFNRLREGMVDDYRPEYLNQFIPQYFRDGGMVRPSGKKLSGDYMFEIFNTEPNAEVEKDEYVKTPDGILRKVEGESHEKGGVKVNLEPETRILSDNLKIGKYSDEVKKLFNVNVKKTDTFAKVVDKVSDKIGYTETSIEQQKSFDQLNKQEDVKDEITANINKSFLNRKISQLDLLKRSLNKKRQAAFEKSYELQEKSKGNEVETFETTPIFKDGGKIQYKDGGLAQSAKFKAMCKKHGLSIEEGMNLLGNFMYGGKKEKYQQGGEADFTPHFMFDANGNQFYANTYEDHIRMSEAGYVHEDEMKYGGKKKKYQDGGEDDFVLKNPALANVEGIQHKDPVTGVFYEPGKEFSASERIAWFIQNMPELSNKYFEKKSDGNYGLKEGAKVEDFQKEYNTYVDDTVKYYEQYANTAFRDENTRKEFLTNLNKYKETQKFSTERGSASSIDDLFGQFTSTRGGFKKATLTPEQLEVLNRNNIRTLTDLTKPENKDTVLSVVDPTKYNELVELEKSTGIADFVLTPVMEAPSTEAKKPTDTDSDVRRIDIRNPERYFGIPMLPDQSIIAPSGLEPQLKTEARFDRVDPSRVSNVPFLQAAKENMDFVESSLDGLPSSQRMSFLAGSVASNTKGINEQLFKNEVANIQNKQQVDMFNAQTQAREEMFNIQQDLSFEQRSQLGRAKYEENLNRYFEALRGIGVGEYNTINKFRTLNSIFENFKINPIGDIQQSGQAEFFNPTQL